jgi:hypothetical protein
MAVTRNWLRTLGQFLPNGATPKTANQNNVGSLIPAGSQTVTTLRCRTDIEMYVLCLGSGSANIDLSVFYETVMMVGVIASKSGGWTTSPTPITDTSPPSTTASLGDWGQWEYLYPTVDFVNTLTPQVALVTWRPKNGTIDTQFRRAAGATTGIDLWMPWEIQDGSGLINTSTGGVTYNLGVRFAQSYAYELKS